MKKILKNKIKCLRCGEIIESKETNDFVECSCGSVAVDGGKDYQKIIGNPKDYDKSYTV